MGLSSLTTNTSHVLLKAAERNKLLLSRFEVWNPLFLTVSSFPCFEEEEEEEEEEEMARSSRP